MLFIELADGLLIGAWPIRNRTSLLWLFVDQSELRKTPDSSWLV